MTTFLIIVGSLVLIVLGYLLYRAVMFKVERRRMDQKRHDRIRDLAGCLERGDRLTRTDVHGYFQNRQTRVDAHALLLGFEQLDAIPDEFKSLVIGAEGQLAIWLEFPTELDAAPSEMEHMGHVSIGSEGTPGEVRYETFRFRMDPPHWAAKDGWMIGVVGPFAEDSLPYEPVNGTFSRFNSIEGHTAEEEVLWVHSRLMPGEGITSPLVSRYQPR